MLIKTHIAFSILISLILIDLLKIQKQLLFVAIVIIFTLIPDLDEKTSFISKKLKLSFIIRFFTTHRGLFHTILIPLIISIIFYSIDQTTMAFGVMVGYLSHLALDSLTKQGITPLWPLKKKIKGFVRAGGFVDRFLFIIFILLDIYYLIKII